MKKAFLSLFAVLAICFGMTSPAHATPFNTTITTTLNTCNFQEIYGPFGTTPFVTSRIAGVQEANSSCEIVNEAIHWVSGNVTSYSYRNVQSGLWGGSKAFASQAPSPWYQRNGPDGATAYAAVFCLDTYNFSPDDTSLDYRKYKVQMRWNDGVSAGSALLLSDNATCSSSTGFGGAI